jgi:hypothetical protein
VPFQAANRALARSSGRRSRPNSPASWRRVLAAVVRGGNRHSRAPSEGPFMLTTAPFAARLLPEGVDPDNWM